MAKTGIGKYRHDVEVQASTRVKNGAGGSSTTWAKLIALKGHFKFDGLMGDDEDVVGNEVQATRRGWLEVRYFGSAITTAMRVRFGARIFNILATDRPEESTRSGRLRLRVEERDGET